MLGGASAPVDDLAGGRVQRPEGPRLLAGEQQLAHADTWQQVVLGAQTIVGRVVQVEDVRDVPDRDAAELDRRAEDVVAQVAALEPEALSERVAEGRGLEVDHRLLADHGRGRVGMTQKGLNFRIGQQSKVGARVKLREN